MFLTLLLGHFRPTTGLLIQFFRWRMSYAARLPPDCMVHSGSIWFTFYASGGQNYLTLALLTYLSLIKQKQFLISSTEFAYHSNNISAFCSHILSLYWNSFQHGPSSHQRSWPVSEPGDPSRPLAFNPQPCGRPHIQVSTELLQEHITVGEPSWFIP